MEKPRRCGQGGAETPSRSPRGPGWPGESGLAPRSPCMPRAAAAGPGSQPLTTRDLDAAHAVLLDPRGLFPSHRGGGAPSPLGPPMPVVTECLVADPFRVHSVHQTVLISAGQSRGEEASEERPDRQDPRWRPWFIFGPRRPSRHILETHGGSGVRERCSPPAKIHFDIRQN